MVAGVAATRANPRPGLIAPPLPYLAAAEVAATAADRRLAAGREGAREGLSDLLRTVLLRLDERHGQAMRV